MKHYSTPRRFDLTTMLVVITAYALLFTVLKALDVGVSSYAYVTGFITLVAIAQSLLATWQAPCHISFLFRNDPRQVSILVGIIFYVVVVEWTYGAAYCWKAIQGGPSLTQRAALLLAILLPGTLWVILAEC